MEVTLRRPRALCLLSFVVVVLAILPPSVSEGEAKEEGTCAQTEAIEKIEPKYKPSQAALTAFFKLHEPADENWKAPFAVLEVTDGCPLNGMYRRFKMWINEGMTAFPNLKLKTVPGMDPIMQFQQTESVPEGDLGIARVDISEMEIGEVEELLQRRGILKDVVLADKAEGLRKEREAKEAVRDAARAKELEGDAQAIRETNSRFMVIFKSEALLKLQVPGAEVRGSV